MTGTAYDYIIVGAGSAGCVLAEQLTRCGHHKVLLLEAGGSDARFWIKVPIGYAVNYANPALNWGYRTDADEGLAGRSTYWPRGRVVGGSSSINAMAYVRGLPHDFDDWAATGATGWDWDAVRQTYDAIEDAGGGPVRVADLSDRMHPFSARFLDAARQAGHPLSPDMNRAEGVGHYRSTVWRGRRWSAADAFLRPALRRPNLRIETDAHVTGLRMDGRRVTGLTWSRRGHTHHALAGQEVILSAGAINSPQILQLSGIGPAAYLQTLGVTPVIDLPQVGEGLQDHLAITHQFHATVPTLNAMLGRRRGRLAAGARYLLTRNGPLSVPVNQVGGFVRSRDGLAHPDMQLFCNPASYSLTTDGQVEMDRDGGFILSGQFCRPTSRGQVRITSGDPGAAPAIRPASLGTAEDRAAAVAASRLARDLSRVPALRDVTRAPKCADLHAMDDAALLQDFRERATTVYHPSCTCRMGHDPAGSVIDARLRVHGIDGLRVVDASSFPNITSGNTNAPVMMLAMRAAGMILQDAR
ncbi:GMC family oxidoreductase N-terminal domain-containing protein [Paracoccus sp. PARArs4]|uniref:GMC family oxidoreductase n=1 Tax=Paracoccus sp. PARArs4 TaxID=2853442 RepID=UPI0024A64D9E|nr:GMC family oxidoreductase N-terminal domain-containing protein [Paracoccus sp. PARArs4]